MQGKPGSVLAQPRDHPLALLREPLLPRDVKHAAYLLCAVAWQIGSLSLPEGHRATPPPPPSPLSPQSRSGKYLKATEVGVPFDVSIGWLLFLFLFFFFFNNQSSKKRGELTA